MRQNESAIQQMCVRWFGVQYPKLKRLLFAVPNGGSRHVAEAAKLKREGVVAGVSDLVLLMPSGQYCALCIEMKTRSGRQTSNQKQWQKAAEGVGARYVICRSLDEFMQEVNTHLRGAANNKQIKKAD